MVPFQLQVSIYDKNNSLWIFIFILQSFQRLLNIFRVWEQGMSLAERTTESKVHLELIHYFWAIYYCWGCWFNFFFLSFFLVFKKHPSARITNLKFVPVCRQCEQLFTLNLPESNKFICFFFVCPIVVLFFFSLTAPFRDAAKTFRWSWFDWHMSLSCRAVNNSSSVIQTSTFL